MGVTGQTFPALRFFVAICAASVLLCSCSSSAKNVQLAKQNVDAFHAQLDAEQYAAMYAATDEKFHQVTTEADFDKLLQAIHHKLGNVQQADLRNTGVAWHTGTGATVTLLYDTKFAEGSGTEQFTWHVTDTGATLYGYHINSNALVTK